MTTKCDRKRLYTNSSGGGMTIWSYRADVDNVREHDVLSRNWWQPLADMIRAGDPIFVSGRGWGCWLFVASNTFDPCGVHGKCVVLDNAVVTVSKMCGTS
jgi:hypothetical protein